MRRAPIAHRDRRVPVRRERQGADARHRHAIENHHAMSRLAHAMRVLGRARRAHAKLPVPQRPLEPDADGHRALAAVLEGEGVHRPGHVRVLPEGGEEGPAHHEVTDRRGEGREPLQCPLPRDAGMRQRDLLAIHANHRPGECGPAAIHEVRASGELDRRAGAAMQQPDGMDGPVVRMDARQGKPVVPRDLPGDGREGGGGGIERERGESHVKLFGVRG